MVGIDFSHQDTGHDRGDGTCAFIKPETSVNATWTRADRHMFTQHGSGKMWHVKMFLPLIRIMQQMMPNWVLLALAEYTTAMVKELNSNVHGQKQAPSSLHKL